MRIDTFKGLNNQQAPTEFGLEGMVQADNVDITDAFKVRLRNGRRKLATASIDAAWSSGEGDVLYQSAGTLYLMQTGLPTLSVSVDTGLTNTGVLRGFKLNGILHWSNGAQSGEIVNGSSRAIGIKTPNTPNASQFFGAMPVGRYMYAVTLTRADGYESSAGLSGLIDITEGGIEVPSPVANGVTKVNLYLSTANGEVLYHAVTTNYGDLLMYAGDTLDLVTPLRYQFCDAPPHFDLATFYRGCMYYAKGNVLYASKPFNFGMVDYALDYEQLSAPIVLLEAVENGIFVSTALETVFLSGTTIREFALNKVLDYGAIKGTAKRIYASTINPKQAGNVVLWASNRGLVAGFDSGQVSVLTDQIFAFPEIDQGTSILREENGLRQFLISLPSEIFYPDTFTEAFSLSARVNIEFTGTLVDDRRIGGFDLSMFTDIALNGDVELPEIPVPFEIVVTGNQEGSNAVFTVSMTGNYGEQLDHEYAFSGTATAPDLGDIEFSDEVFDTGDGYLAVPDGVNEFTVTVPLINDGLVEVGETLTLTVGDVSATITIIDV